MVPNLWHKWVLDHLHTIHRSQEGKEEPSLSTSKGVPKMLKSIRLLKGLKKTFATVVVGKAVVIVKNCKKCSMIFMAKGRP